MLSDSGSSAFRRGTERILGGLPSVWQIQAAGVGVFVWLDDLTANANQAAKLGQKGGIGL